jgi:hypothetical protein
MCPAQSRSFRGLVLKVPASRRSSWQGSQFAFFDQSRPWETGALPVIKRSRMREIRIRIGSYSSLCSLKQIHIPCSVQVVKESYVTHTNARTTETSGNSDWKAGVIMRTAPFAVMFAEASRLFPLVEFSFCHGSARSICIACSVKIIKMAHFPCEWRF